MMASSSAATAGEFSETTALVHSLITLTISDQWTRSRVQNDGIQKAVVGALLGKHSGRNVEFLNTFEVRTTATDNEETLMTVDEEYFAVRETMFKETFPNIEFLGFYITGDHTTTDEQDASLQKQAGKFCESPFLLKLDAANPVICDKLSLSVFESVVDPSSNGSSILFHPTQVKIISELAEQIGLDHVARFSNTGKGSESTAAKNLSAHFGAVNNLIQGVQSAHEYVKAVQEGKVKKNDAILRDIYKLSQMLSTPESDDLREREIKQNSDQKMILLLTSMTNVQGSMFDLVTKFNVISAERYDRAMGAMAMKKHGGRHNPFFHPERMGFF